MTASSLVLKEPNAFDLIPSEEEAFITPAIEIDNVGIASNQSRDWYTYSSGPDDQKGREYLGPVLQGVVTDVEVVYKGKAGRTKSQSWEGNRPYLQVTLLCKKNGQPRYRLCKLPASSSQIHYRSLLGALIKLSLQDTSVKMQTEAGRKVGVTLIHVYVDFNREAKPAPAEWIGEELFDLHAAVDRCRKSLGKDPQFPDIQTA